MLDINELFREEHDILAAAKAVAEDPALPAERYRSALSTVTGCYQRLVRESYRLISRSDRAERELTRLNKQLQKLATQLEYEATHDPLTSVYNRGAIIKQISGALAENHASLILLDIDHFKKINDEHGHPTGDRVICGLVARIRHCVPEYSRVGRIGGEEFTILLPEAALEDAVAVAGGICESLNVLPLEALPDRLVTASFGVSWCDRHASFETLYGCADAALYHAKNRGRNQVSSLAMAQNEITSAGNYAAPSENRDTA